MGTRKVKVTGNDLDSSSPTRLQQEGSLSVPWHASGLGLGLILSNTVSNKEHVLSWLTTGNKFKDFVEIIHLHQGCESLWYRLLNESKVCVKYKYAFTSFNTLLTFIDQLLCVKHCHRQQTKNLPNYMRCAVWPLGGEHGQRHPCLEVSCFPITESPLACS